MWAQMALEITAMVIDCSYKVIGISFIEKLGFYVYKDLWNAARLELVRERFILGICLFFNLVWLQWYLLKQQVGGCTQATGEK